MSEFVEPNVVRIPLSGTDRWIDVKQELNAGEFDVMNDSVLKDVIAGEKALLVPRKVPSYKIIAYLVGWSFKDKDGKSIPVSPAAIDNLRRQVRDEIAAAVEAHADRSEADVDERKNDAAPESRAASISAER